MALTNDEIFDVTGDLLKGVAERMRDEDSPGEISKKEWLELAQQVVLDMLKEIND